MKKAVLKAIEYHLPETRLDNEDLVSAFPDWDAEKIYNKTGIRSRRVAGDSEVASDLGYQAATKLFEADPELRERIDFILFCTQSPDYYLPATACLLQNRLGLRREVGSMDIPQGCTGFVQGVGVAKALIESGQASHVLLITAETYSKYIDPSDRSVLTLFGDGATASYLTAVEADSDQIGPMIYGTDGKGGKHLILPGVGMRAEFGEEAQSSADERHSHGGRLYMNGPEIFNFTLRRVPHAYRQLLEKARLEVDDIAKVVFHQANKYMLDHLRKKIGIPEDKFVICLEEVGNTVSSSIPIALKATQDLGQLRSGDKVMLLSFGVGYSWNGAIITWNL